MRLKIFLGIGARSWLPLVYFLFPLHACAQEYVTELGKSVAKLGAQGNFFYVSFSEGFSRSCKWDNIYIATDRRGLYAQLLTAKLTGRRVHRVDYTLTAGPGSVCNLEVVELLD